MQRSTSSMGLLAALPFALGLAISGVATAQEANERDTQSKRPSDAATPRQPAPTDAGFWPTPRMMELFLERGAEDIARQHSLNDEQKAWLIDDMKQRWPAFMNRHRTVIQPLMNEMIEQGMSEQAPTAEQAARWATAALPVFEDVKKEIDAGVVEFRKILNEEQREILKSEMTKLNMGYSFLTTRAKEWKEGRFNPSEWPGGRRRGRNRDRDRNRNRDATASAPSAPAEEAAVAFAADPKDEWTRYVEQFIAAYGLVDGQRLTAESILKDMKERTAPLFSEYARVTDELKSGGAGDVERLRQKHNELRNALDGRFSELKQRLDAVLTSAQRARGTLSTRPAAESSGG
ncbi:MAG: hypothetical protein HUU22_00075 [Phycisphaerae bacterium]|nr:hypothetical protein [Phycisphaerae bacterium]NUQ44409.1 hypothetical protein [Phycisphaerae bacterium]